jgi:hypothetical protein
MPRRHGSPQKPRAALAASTPEQAGGEDAKSELGLGRHDRVAEGPQSIGPESERVGSDQPRGSPIRASTNSGFKRRLGAAGFDPISPPVGVFRARRPWESPVKTMSVSETPGCAFVFSALREPEALESFAVGVGHVRGLTSVRIAWSPSLPLVGVSASAQAPSFQSRDIGVDQLRVAPTSVGLPSLLA